MRRVVVVATVAMTMTLAAWSGSSASAVARPGSSLPLATTSSTGETGCSAAKPASFAPQSVAGLFETDLATHQRFKAVRALAVDDPHPAVIVGGNLYLTYDQPGNYVCTRIARIPLSGGPVVQSPWRAFSGDLVVAYGSVWVTVDTRPDITNAQVLYELSAATLSVEREISLPSSYDDGGLAASDGAIWIGDDFGTVLGRVDVRTGAFTRVHLLGLKKYRSAQGIAVGPGGSTLYIFAVNQTSSTSSDAIERFQPSTGRFEVVPGAKGFPMESLVGVAGDLLWVGLMGGMYGHVAPVSTVTLAPIPCAQSRDCTFNGLNGTFNVTTSEDLAWMSHAGGWLQCAGGSAGSVLATVRIPGYGPITAGYSGNDSALSFLATGDGYLAVNTQFRGPGGTDVSPEVAIFPLDPRCAS
ncbi:MAG: hypothetical protein ABSD85_14920 [Acidimicrobiales bacterium]|jgi:hypothetical protein